MTLFQHKIQAYLNDKVCPNPFCGYKGYTLNGQKTDFGFYTAECDACHAICETFQESNFDYPDGLIKGVILHASPRPLFCAVKENGEKIIFLPDTNIFYIFDPKVCKKFQITHEEAKNRIEKFNKLKNFY